MAQDTFTIHKWTSDGHRPVWTGTPDADDAPIAWIELLRDAGPSMKVGDLLDLNEWHYAEKVEPSRIAAVIPFTAPAFKTEHAEIIVTAYRDGTPALLLVGKDGEPVEPYEQEDLTVNLGGHGLTPPPGCVYIPDYAQHVGVAQALVEAGVASIIEPVTFGFRRGHLVRLEGALSLSA